MISEKIQNLIQELQSQCEKEEVCLILTVVKEKKASNATLGSIDEIANALAIQEESMNSVLPIPISLLKLASSAKITKAKIVEKEV
jgi:hypothetical protein